MLCPTQQLPVDSLTAWICMHVCRCMHSKSQLAAVEWGKALKWSQKIQCTEKGAHSLENLYDTRSLPCPTKLAQAISRLLPSVHARLTPFILNVDKFSVGQMTLRLRSFAKLSVGQMTFWIASVSQMTYGQMFVGQMTYNLVYLPNVVWPFVCQPNGTNCLLAKKCMLAKWHWTRWRATL